MSNTELTINEQNEAAARERVAQTPELAAHEETIFSDWSNANEHFAWLASAPVAEIIAWAEIIERDTRSA